MRKLALTLLAILCTLIAFSQTPSGFSYQAILRDTEGNIMQNESISIEIAILQGSITGTEVFSEVHATSTNNYGLINLEIGSVNTIDITSIDWSAGPYYLKISINGTEMGTVQLLGVPYALYAVKAEELVSGTPESNTLDMAYDEGGQGAGRIINADAGAVYIDGPDGLAVDGLTKLNGLALPYTFGPDTNYIGDDGSYIGFGHNGTSEDFIGYKDNTFYFKDSPGGGDINDPDVVIGGTLYMESQNIEDLADPINNQDAATKSYVDYTVNDELQALSISNDTIYLTNGGFVALPTDTSWQTNGDNVYTYSNVGVGTPNPAGKMEIIGEASALPEDPLFEVKRNDGQTVFAVYNEGVRVYFDDEAKGARGGFAVGGFSQNKATNPEYLRVTRDSVRIYINDSISKASRGGFAVGGFSQNKAPGQEFLRVTNDSVRVYVNDVEGKGARGGFAVGGFSQSKAPGQEFLRVSNDSVRVYINDELGKGARGGFAVGGFSQSKGLTNQFFNISTESSTEIIYPSEPRILWYPKKEAFLTGRVLIEHPDSVGTNSLASGFESKATGDYSQAMGYQAHSSGENSAAIGNYPKAGAMGSFAFGDSAYALADNAYAIGAHTLASAKGAFALGSYSRDRFGAVEWNTIASGENSIAIGINANASNLNSVALGKNSIALGEEAYAIGPSSMAEGNFSFALAGASALGFNSIAIGSGASAIGPISFAALEGHTNGLYSVAIGEESVTYENYSVAMGYFAKTQGRYSTAIGDHVEAKSQSCFVTGKYNIVEGDSIQHLDADPIFVVGNGTASVRHNAMKIQKDGAIFFPDAYNDLISGSALYINTLGQIGRLSSATRFKKNITDMEDIQWLYELRPVNFQYKELEPDEKQYGLIAEEVEKVNPSFVEYNNNGEIFSVSYNKLITPLLKAIQEHELEIEVLISKNESLEQENEELKLHIQKLEQRQNEIFSKLGSY